MNRVRNCAVLPLKSFAVSFHGAWLVVLGAFLVAATPRQVHAITISIEHTPENENPSWDPNGSILTTHFQAAVAMWQSLLPGPGDYSFDFHWDDDLDANQLGSVHARHRRIHRDQSQPELVCGPHLHDSRV